MNYPSRIVRTIDKPQFPTTEVLFLPPPEELNRSELYYRRNLRDQRLANRTLTNCRCRFQREFEIIAPDIVVGDLRIRNSLTVADTQDQSGNGQSSDRIWGPLL